MADGGIFESDDGLVFFFEPEEPDVALLFCFDCGGELDGVVCHDCSIAWLPTRLFERKLNG